MAYAELTRTVLSPEAPSRFRLLPDQHGQPGGQPRGAGGHGAGDRRRLPAPDRVGVSGSTAGFGLATQGVGSAVVLNAIFWFALIISIPLRGFNPLYGIAAIAGRLAPRRLRRDGPAHHPGPDPGRCG